MKNHKFNKAKGLLSVILLAFLVWNCENVKDYSNPTDNIPPGTVTSVEVVNLHGGAKITYILPLETDLLGVKAVYSLHEGGKEYEMFSSAQSDTIILAGFPDTNEHTVNLYVIDKSRNLSEPIPVTIRPLTPPVDLIRQTLKVNEVFGGVYVSWENIMEENIAVSLYVDSIGEMILDDTYFTNASKSAYSFRGFPNIELSFRVEIRDRWMNYAEPLDTVLTPLFEQQIYGKDPATGTVFWSLWGYASRECLSRGDTYSGVEPWPFSYAFDGLEFDANSFWSQSAEWGYLDAYLPGAPNTLQNPTYYTIDMGRTAVFSRMKKWPRNFEPYGGIGITRHIYEFEVWGTNNPKPLVPELTPEDRITNLRYWTSWSAVDGTDEWKNDWILLADVSLRTPSGAILASDVFTPEDEVFISNGFDIEFNEDKTNIPCRYIRFVCKKHARPESWVDQVAEFQFFGSLVE